MITETDQLAEAIDVAAKIWPEYANERGVLIKKLLEAGITVTTQAAAKQRANRLAAINKVAGRLDTVWPENWRDELHNDWLA